MARTLAPAAHPTHMQKYTPQDHSHVAKRTHIWIKLSLVPTLRNACSWQPLNLLDWCDQGGMRTHLATAKTSQHDMPRALYMHDNKYAVSG